MEYRVEVDDNLAFVERNVNLLLRDGWKLHGSLIIRTESTHTHPDGQTVHYPSYYQALTKEGEDANI